MDHTVLMAECIRTSSRYDSVLGSVSMYLPFTMSFQWQWMCQLIALLDEWNGSLCFNFEHFIWTNPYDDIRSKFKIIDITLLDTRQGIIVELISAVAFELEQLVFIFLWGAVTIECLLLLFKIVDSICIQSNWFKKQDLYAIKIGVIVIDRHYIINCYEACK